MKKYIILLLFTLFAVAPSLHAQASGKSEGYEMDVEEFLGTLSGLLSDYEIEEVDNQIPFSKDIKVAGFGIGDFSGDGIYDVVVALKQKDTPSKTYDVKFLVNENGTFKTVSDIQAHWVDIPLDVAFTVRYGEVFMSHRVGESWHLSSYRFENGNLNMTSDYSDADGQDTVQLQQETPKKQTPKTTNKKKGKN